MCRPTPDALTTPANGMPDVTLHADKGVAPTVPDARCNRPPTWNHAVVSCMGGSVGVALGAEDEVDDELDDDDDGLVTGCTGSSCSGAAADEEAACET